MRVKKAAARNKKKEVRARSAGDRVKPATERKLSAAGEKSGRDWKMPRSRRNKNSQRQATSPNRKRIPGKALRRGERTAVQARRAKRSKPESRAEREKNRSPRSR
jgi:hypothetical protein